MSSGHQQRRMGRLKSACSGSAAGKQYGADDERGSASSSHDEEADGLRKTDDVEEGGGGESSSSETDRDTIGDMEIPQHIDIFDDGGFSTVTPVTWDFPYNYGTSSAARDGGGICVDNYSDSRVSTRRIVLGGILCLFCIAAIAFVLPFMLTREDDADNTDGSGVSIDNNSPAAAPSQDPTSNTRPTTPDIAFEYPSQTNAPTMAPAGGTAGPTWRWWEATFIPEPLEDEVDTPSPTTVAPTPSPSSSSPESPAPSSSFDNSTTAGRASSTAALHGVTWGILLPAASCGEEDYHDYNVMLTCDNGMPLGVEQYNPFTTSCGSIITGEDEDGDSGTSSTAVCHFAQGATFSDGVRHATVLLSCDSSVTVELPPAAAVSPCEGEESAVAAQHFVTLAGYCEEAWLPWGTSCAAPQHVGSTTSTEEDGALDFLMEEILQGIIGSDSEGSFCYSVGNCTTTSSAGACSAAAPIEARSSVSQEACSDDTSGARDLDQAWSALLESSSDVVEEILLTLPP